MDPRELSRLRWRIGAGIGMNLTCIALGAASGGVTSDFAYAGTVLLTLGMAYWVTRWAECSRLVKGLILGAMFGLFLAQLLDLTEDFQALEGIPVFGSDSPWNEPLNSVGLAFGLVLTFAALTFALVETRLGRIAHERYGLLAENISDVIFTADLNLICAYISPSVMKLRGYTVEEALAQRPEESMTAASHVRARKMLDAELERVRGAARQGDAAAAIDLELFRKDGSTVWVETSVSFLFGPDGQPSGVLGVTRDITERKRAEDADRQLNERLTLAIRSGDLGVWDWDVASNTLVWDARMYEIYGVEPTRSGGAFDGWRTAVQPDDLARSERELLAALKGRGEFNSQFRVIWPNGEIRHVQSQATVLRDPKGKPLRMIGMNRDITAQINAEAERARLQEQLSQAQKMESIGRLAGGVAHDFNNMLMVILGFTELAMSAKDVEAGLRGHLEEIRSAALRSAELTRQLLAFARQQAVAPQVLNLNHATENMFNLLERLIGKEIRLTWLPGESLWNVKVDPSQLDQILANLCVNARDAIEGDGEIIIQTGNVSLDAMVNLEDEGAVPGEYVRLSVSDTGCGMDAETLTRIYEPFFTTKRIGKGTGLGLSTVYGIVKQNDGFISVKSAPGQGTTFTIHLPRHARAETCDPDEESLSPLAPGKERILLVDDEKVILEIAQIMLERLGYTVLAAATPGEAIQLAESQSEPIQLLLTDIVMPEMNGRDLTRMLLKRFPGMKHLFMSGFTPDLVSRSDILREGKNFIQKPFGMAELAAKLRYVLDHKDAEGDEEQPVPPAGATGSSEMHETLAE